MLKPEPSAAIGSDAAIPNPVTGNPVRADQLRPAGKPRPGSGQDGPLSVWFLLRMTLFALLFFYIHAYHIWPALMKMGSVSHPAYRVYEHLLSPGWWDSRPIDDSDHQYRVFRSFLPTLSLALGAYCVVGWLLQPVVQTLITNPHPQQQRLSVVRRCWSVVFSLLLLHQIHGYGVVKILIIQIAFYWLVRTVSHRYVGPALLWSGSILLLFLNDHYQGYRFHWLHPRLAFMDDQTGYMERWYILFNFNVLRMISFGMDYYWRRSPAAADVQRAHVHCSRGCTRQSKCDRFRLECPHADSDYSLFNYLCYCLYAPLYMAGPILPFNDFLYQIKHPVPWTAAVVGRIALYGARLVAIIALMEWMMHHVYAMAISKAKVWIWMSPLELCVFSLVSVFFIWLKLMVIWRFFRFWALADRIETVENMQRCLYNNYSARDFWTYWHASYNRWILRYIYFPVGGKDHRWLNMLLVFTFVAIWHDIQLRLLIWGWLSVFIIVPELLKHKWYFSAVAAFGGALNVILMILSNLIGFGVGLDGAADLLTQLFSVSNILFLVIMVVLVSIQVHIMFDVRVLQDRWRAQWSSHKLN